MSKKKQDKAIVIQPDHGRKYECGNMNAIFKFDEESGSKYAVSEWWIAPETAGPGIQHHKKNKDVVYVLEGKVTFIIDNERINASKGSCIRIPANVPHDFENGTGKKAGMLNFFIPGGFEPKMPAIVEWYKNQN